jgi:hypothetical protein
MSGGHVFVVFGVSLEVYDFVRISPVSAAIIMSIDVNILRLFITWQLVSSQNLGHHEAKIQEGEKVQ